MQRAVAEPMCTTQNTQPTWANREEQVFASFNPFTPNISLVIPLAVCHALLMMLVWRI